MIWSLGHVFFRTVTRVVATEVVRHLADYVLIWAGDGGDDIAKSPHMARIAASVYHDLCPGDPLCGLENELMTSCSFWKLA